MNIWLAIRFPLLSLESLLSMNKDKKDTNTNLNIRVVIENNLVFCANEAAAQLGIKINQKISHVFALSDKVELLTRNTKQEEQQLTYLASVFYRFSPAISIQKPDFILLEISRSLKLYKGINNLLNQLEDELDFEKTTYQIGLGHTPKSAQLLSFKLKNEKFNYLSLFNWENEKPKLCIAKIEEQLSQLPIYLMDLLTITLEKFSSIGLKTLGDIFQLPQSSIRKRFGKEAYYYILQLLGTLPEPTNHFLPTEVFYQKFELVDVIHYRQGLLFPIKRLIKNLCYFLRLKQKNCQQLSWDIFDSEKNTYNLIVDINQQEINSKTYLQLTELKLQQYQLKAPVEAIALSVDKLTDFSLNKESLFSNIETFEQSINFIDKIKAKLGSEICYQIEEKDEYIPEVAFIKNFDFVKNNDKQTFNSEFNKTNKPLWLLNLPQRITHKHPLKLISSVEKIACQWWNKKIIRSYFLAEDSSGIIYWIFYDELSCQWFLQGVYS